MVACQSSNPFLECYCDYFKVLVLGTESVKSQFPLFRFLFMSNFLLVYKVS